MCMRWYHTHVQYLFIQYTKKRNTFIKICENENRLLYLI